MTKETVKLKNNTTVTGDAFDEKDLSLILEIFNDCQQINKKLKTLGGRNLNVPDVFSEALFCLFFDAVRTNGTAYSYDCVTRKGGYGVQVKSCSIKNDCTSFGPTSTWDLLYFVDFAPNGKVDGNVWFYKIDFDISNIVLNKKKNQTFAMQQAAGRRPRFSIKKEIIQASNLQPVLKINLLDKNLKIK